MGVTVNVSVPAQQIEDIVANHFETFVGEPACVRAVDGALDD
jgi:hypothetical protein